MSDRPTEPPELADRPELTPEEQQARDALREELNRLAQENDGGN